MTNFTGDGLQIAAQDLSKLSLSSEDDGRMFHHDGSSEIILTGGVKEQSLGFYIWDNSAKEWYPPFNNVDTLDGKQAGDFLLRDGSLSMQGSLDIGNYGIVNLGNVSGGTGEIHLNDNNVEIHSNTIGADIRLTDNNGLLIASAIEGGNFNVPNGELQEGGARVATRTWTNANADVPNADYADNADKLDGDEGAAFLHVSGDQMEGVLDLGTFNLEDGTDVVWDAVNSEVPQSSLGGPASSLSAYPLTKSDFDRYTDSEARSAVSGASISGGLTLGGDSTGLIDGGTVNSPLETLRGYYDSDGTTGVTATSVDAALEHVPNADGSSTLDIRVQSTDVIRAFSTGNVDVPLGTISEQGNRVATRLWASGSNILHSELADAPVSAHHTRYADSEAIAAINGEVSLSVNISGDANSVDGYDIQKNGTDTTGVINFKT